MARRSPTSRPEVPRKRPRGRPPVTVTGRYLPVITKLAAKGVRQKDIARAIGMSMPTWAKLRDSDPQVAAAFEAGEQLLHDALIGKLYEKAMNGDTIALIYATKILLGYRDRDTPQADEAKAGNADGQRSVLVVPAIQTREQWEKLAAQHHETVGQVKPEEKVSRTMKAIRS